MPIDLTKNDNLQRLYLLEFLVDSVKFDYDKIDLSETTLDLLQQTCVRFRFLDFPVIEVCEEDFCKAQPIYDKASKIVFKNGKSFFFSMSCLPPNTKCLMLGAIVLRHKDEPPPVIIGTCCIILGNDFMDMLNGVTGNDEASKSLNDIYPILDDRGIIIGSLTLLVRFSCFGKAIITHFKVPQENDAGYMFANTKDQGRKPTTNREISHGYLGPNNQTGQPRRIDAFNPRMNYEGGVYSGNVSPAGVNMWGTAGNTNQATPHTFPRTPTGMSPTEVPGVYPGNVPPVGINAWGTTSNAPLATPETFPSTPSATFSNNLPGMYPGTMPDRDENMWGMSGTTFQPSSETFPGAQSETFPGTSLATFPGTAQGTFPGTAQGIFPGTAQGTFPGTAQGAFPRTTQGAFPGTAQGAFPRTTQGAFPGTAQGTFPSTMVTSPQNATGTYHGGMPHPNETTWSPHNRPPITGTLPEVNEESTAANNLNDNKNLQKLFLLELLVDNVKFDYEKVDLPESVLDMLMQTCVRFNFLDFPSIEVCEEDFCPSKAKYDRASKSVFKNGKSYFFPLNCMPPKIKSLNIGAIVLRCKHGPPPVMMGTSCIVLDKGFWDILNGDSKTESSKSLHDVFPIYDERGITIGSLTVLVRLSCFGKTVITHFKVSQEQDAGYMFANAKDTGHKVDLAKTHISKTPITPDPDRNKQINRNNMVYPEMYTGASPVLGSAPMVDSSSSVPKTSPMIFRGFPGNQSKPPGTPLTVPK